MGRPSVYSDDIAEAICEHLADGNSLRSWCMAEPGRPNYGTVMRWLAENDTFRENHARAREAQGHNDADAVADVRAKVASGELTPEQGRVITDSLKWTAGVRLPKVYGARVALDSDALTSIAGSLAEARKRAGGDGD